MGKKKIIQKTKEELLKERDAVESAIVKAGARKTAKRLDRGNVYVAATYNNTLITVTDERGNVVMWSSAGSLGFSGPKKATPFAASKVVAALSEKMRRAGLKTINIFVRGVGRGRDSAIRSLANQGFTITMIKDVTPIPHNGPRPKKVRRV